ncbi:alpha/beta fold hydrolase [Actinokineospora auranticolor]|uniref:Surfactin synthase thioesterase subunit n=1 Tax=Actinokineospora auranticolor TaxID=155976 RepID=A0A2S6H134_9PSEU|nr:alpha/beta fold hydrolase [Actinokineospora auranticolor]PPK71185.1 surfactin synthase thioesterase subunit [Actinokineospora auranticolor]
MHRADTLGDLDWRVCVPGTPWVGRAPARGILLLCFPGAGKGSVMYHRWQEEGLDPLAVRLPGRESRFGEPAATEVAELADEAAEALFPLADRPFAIFGHSMGALVGFEVARRLAARGRPPRRLFVSAGPAPHLPSPHRLRARGLSDEELLAAARRAFDSIADAVPEDRRLLGPLLRPLRADLAMVERYRHCPTPPMSFPITAFAGREDSYTPVDEIREWRVQTSADFRLRVFPGGHFYLDECRRELLRDIRSDLV